jgi:hypothetical protein
MSTRSRHELIVTLRGLLGDAFALHQKGATGASLGRTYGMADGYMRALIDLGMATQKELGVVVLEERTRTLGPATRTLVSETLMTEPVASDTIAA